jgi:N-acetylglucosamine-6-phosphate deacetylase
VQNLMAFTGASLNTAAAAASHNPSQLMGIDDNWGCIDPGRIANITVLSPTAVVIQTFLSGRAMTP